jgi:hypothetical protein
MYHKSTQELLRSFHKWRNKNCDKSYQYRKEFVKKICDYLKTHSRDGTLSSNFPSDFTIEMYGTEPDYAILKALRLSPDEDGNDDFVIDAEGDKHWENILSRYLQLDDIAEIAEYTIGKNDK